MYNTQDHTHLSPNMRPHPPVSEHERALGLRRVEGGRGAADDEGRAGVTSETLLQYPRQLAVSVGDVRFLEREKRCHQCVVRITQMMSSVCGWDIQ